MCRQDHRSGTKVDNGILRKNIDWSPVEEVLLQGGEILAMKEAKDFYLWLTNEMRKKANITTNGMLINDEWAEHLMRGSNCVTVSVNAATKETHEAVNCGSDFFKVLDNIKKLISRKRSGGAAVDIVFHFTIVPENIHEIVDAIELADDLGCDTINYGYSNSVPAFLETHGELSDQVKSSLIRLLDSRDLRVKIAFDRLKLLGIY